MTFLWPWFLALLLLIPLLIAAYILLLRRKRKFAVRYSSLSLIREAMPRRSRWRQYFPLALFLLALANLIIALARPSAEVQVPLSRTSIILALDVSRSMCAIDVHPNRFKVAQDAALAFIDAQDEGARIGLVAFAGLAEIIVPPTNDKERLKAAVSNLTTALGTAIGSATLKSIDAIAEVNPDVPSSRVDLSGLSQGPLVEGAGYQPDIIVLLTDGANSRGPFPLDAAEIAAQRRVRIYTIGFGTDNPQEMVCTREQLGSDSFGNFGNFGGGFGGGGGISANLRRFLVIDEQTLQAMADMTGGAYYRAENADQLVDVFTELPSQIVLQKEQIEISVLFLSLAGFFMVMAIFLSLIWNRFP